MSKRSTAAVVKALSEAVKHHPNTPVGKLIGNAVNISRGQTQSNPAFAADSEVLAGLKALVPSDWEQEKDREKGKK